MSNADPKPGGFQSNVVLEASELNILRAGVLNSLDIGGGSRTMLAKLTLLGADRFELEGQLLYTSSFATRGFGVRNASYVAASWQVNTGVLDYAQTLVATVAAYAIDLDHLLPHGNVLSSVTVYFTGPAANATTPTSLPTLSIYKTSLVGGVTSQIGSTTTDTYGSSAAYKTRHPITCGSLAETIDRATYKYYLNFTSEGGGGGALAGAFLGGGSVQCQITKQPRGM